VNVLLDPAGFLDAGLIAGSTAGRAFPVGLGQPSPRRVGYPRFAVGRRALLSRHGKAAGAVNGERGDNKSAHRSLLLVEPAKGSQARPRRMAGGFRRQFRNQRQVKGRTVEMAALEAAGGLAGVAGIHVLAAAAGAGAQGCQQDPHRAASALSAGGSNLPVGPVTKATLCSSQRQIVPLKFMPSTVGLHGLDLVRLGHSVVVLIINSSVAWAYCVRRPLRKRGGTPPHG